MLKLGAVQRRNIKYPMLSPYNYKKTFRQFLENITCVTGEKSPLLRVKQ